MVDRYSRSDRSSSVRCVKAWRSYFPDSSTAVDTAFRGSQLGTSEQAHASHSTHTPRSSYPKRDDFCSKSTYSRKRLVAIHLLGAPEGIVDENKDDDCIDHFMIWGVT